MRNEIELETSCGSAIASHPEERAQNISDVDFDRNVFCILGLPFDALTLQESVTLLRRDAFMGRRCFLSTPNTNFVVASQVNSEFRSSVLRSDLSVADGMPIIWVARLLRLPIVERVAGADLFEKLGEVAGKPLLVYFFGGMNGAAERASARLSLMCDGLSGVGGWSPGTGSVDELSRPDAIHSINRSGAHFLVVSLGAAKGQAWIERNQSEIQAPIISHLGAVVNFVDGQLRRAPQWARTAGLEWCWRIVGEKHLWRRYWNDGVALVSLFVLKLLPLIWLLRVSPNARERLLDRSISLHEAAGRCSIVISGAWRWDDCSELRGALKNAVRVKKPIDIIVADQSYLDLGVVALFLLLEGFCSKDGRELTMESRDRWVSRLFFYCRLGNLK